MSFNYWRNIFVQWAEIREKQKAALLKTETLALSLENKLVKEDWKDRTLDEVYPDLLWIFRMISAGLEKTVWRSDDYAKHPLFVWLFRTKQIEEFLKRLGQEEDITIRVGPRGTIEPSIAIKLPTITAFDKE